MKALVTIVSHKLKPMKTKKNIIIIATAIPSFLFIFSAICKLSRAPLFADAYAKAGITEFLTPLGLTVFFFLALFLYPKTFKVGFFLLCSYLGGAIVAHLTNGDKNIFDAVLSLTLFWISAFLREKSLFITANNT